jgi:hypothetical protein
MAKSKATVWLVGLAIYFGCLGMAKSDEDVDVRLVAETKILFRTVLADETPPERCELEPTWQTYSIPKSVAREHFGLTLYTTAPFGQSPRDILELAGGEDFVCSAERAEGERLRQYESSGKKSLIYRRTGYTFPVFSDDYKSAAPVVYQSSQGWTRMPGGVKALPLRVEAIGYVAVYKKIEGSWWRVATIELFVT